MPMIQAEMSKADQCNRRLSIKNPEKYFGIFLFYNFSFRIFLHFCFVDSFPEVT